MWLLLGSIEDKANKIGKKNYRCKSYAANTFTQNFLSNYKKMLIQFSIFCFHITSVVDPDPMDPYLISGSGSVILNFGSGLHNFNENLGSGSGFVSLLFIKDSKKVQKKVNYLIKFMTFLLTKYFLNGYNKCPSRF
jgi:hypothetical protein